MGILKGGENNWSPAEGDDGRRRIFRDMNEICVQVEEDHVWVSEFNVVLQDQLILKHVQYVFEVSCILSWCLL